MISAKSVLFAAPDDDLAEAEARAYIAMYGLTKDDVRIVKRGSMLVVESRREVTLVAK